MTRQKNLCTSVTLTNRMCKNYRHHHDMCHIHCPKRVNRFSIIKTLLTMSLIIAIGASMYGVTNEHIDVTNNTLYDTLYDKLHMVQEYGNAMTDTIRTTMSNYYKF